MVFPHQDKPTFMFQQTPRKPVLSGFALRQKIGLQGIALFIFALFATTGMLTAIQPQTAAATSNSTINFQARLETASGAIAADGNYNVEFKLYNASTSTGSSQGSCTGDANCLWTETRTSANQVRVANGYLSVSLGSVTAFPTINWNQPLWLTMNIGGTGASPSWDGEMNPRLQLTAVPYAFQAGALGDGSNQALLDASGNLVFQQASIIQALTAASGTTLTLQGGAATSGTNIGGSLLLQGGGGASTGASGSVIVKSNTNNSTAAFQVQNAAGTQLFNVDTSGNNVEIASDTSLNFDGATGNNKIKYISGLNDLQFANYGGGLVQIQSDNFQVQDTTGFHTNLNMTNTGATTFQNRVDSTAAFQIQNAAGRNLFTIDTTNSNVGIGISVPSNSLSVSPLDYQTGTVTRTNGSATLTGTGTTWTSSVVGDIVIFADGTTNTVTGFTSATSITLGATYTGTTDASPVSYRFHKVGLQVASSGNVGIGTTGPDSRLVVSSGGDTSTRYTARFQSSGSVGGAGGILFDQNSTYSYKLWTQATSSTTGQLIWSYINHSTGADQYSNILALQSGNVGIGTVSPQKTLDVKGGALTAGTASTYAFGVGNATQGDFTIGSDSSYTYLQSWNGKPLQVNSQGNNILLDPGSGNVGIGTTSAGSKLTVAGSFYTGGGNFELDDAGVSDSTAVRLFSSSGNLYLQNGSGGNTFFRNKTAGTTVTIQDAGNVGIGTTPSYKLDVSGNAHISSTFNVDGKVGFGTTATNWPLQVKGNGPPGAQLLLQNSGGGSGWALGPDNSGNNITIYDMGTSCGGVYMLAGGNSWNARCSDERLKTNITPLPSSDGIQSLRQLTPVSYSWIDSTNPSDLHWGIIAQTVQPVYPFLVQDTGNRTITMPDGSQQTFSDVLTVDSSDLIWPTIMAVKDLDTEITNLTGQVQNQQSEIAALQANTNFASLNVSGAATISTLTVTGDATFKANIIVGGHIVTSGNVPTSAILAAAGTDAQGNTTGTCTVTGNDTSGSISIAMGSSNVANGAQCTITFTQPFSAAPHPVLTPINKDSVGIGAYINVTANDMTVYFNQAPQATQTYAFNFLNMQ